MQSSYRQAFEDYITKKHYDGIHALVAFSGKVKLDDDDKEYTEASMIKSDKLKTSAKNNTQQDFEFAYFDDIDDALIEGLSQNQDFFSLLFPIMK